MANFITFLFIITISFNSIFLQTEAYTKCSNEGPHIHFPFHPKGQRSRLQNDPAFELLCKDNTTMIHFPSYGHDLVVKSISYNAKKLDLLNPKSCVHEAFLNLNLSLTPFSYYYVVKSYTYLNCSTKLSPSFIEIPCLSDYGHYVYTVEPSMDVPISCKAIKTIAIPFKYNPYLADNSFGLGLTWGSIGGQGCDGKEACALQIKNEGFKVGLVQVLGIGIIVFTVAAAFSTIKTIYYSNKPACEKEFSGINQLEVEKFLGDYRGFSSTDEAYVDQVSNG